MPTKNLLYYHLGLPKPHIILAFYVCLPTAISTSVRATPSTFTNIWKRNLRSSHLLVMQKRPFEIRKCGFRYLQIERVDKHTRHMVIPTESPHQNGKVNKDGYIASIAVNFSLKIAF